MFFGKLLQWKMQEAYWADLELVFSRFSVGSGYSSWGEHRSSERRK